MRVADNRTRQAIARIYGKTEVDSLGPRSIQLGVIGQGDDRQLGNQVVIGRCWRIFRLEPRSQRHQLGGVCFGRQDRGGRLTAASSRRADVALDDPARAPTTRERAPFHSKLRGHAPSAGADGRPCRASWRRRWGWLWLCYGRGFRRRWNRLCGGSWDRRSRHFLAGLQQIAQQGAHRHRIAGLGRVRGNAQDAAGKGFDLVEGLVAFHRKENFAGLDCIAIGFEPLDEGALLHGPPQAGHCDWLGHALAPTQPSGRGWPVLRPPCWAQSRPLRARCTAWARAHR